MEVVESEHQARRSPMLLDPLHSARIVETEGADHRDTAVYSSDMVYRYALERVWLDGADASRMVWVLLNPATGDTDGKRRPTLQRCVNRAKAMGYSGLTIVNLFAFRATNPAELRATEDPIGPSNNEVIHQRAENAEVVIAAWGTHGRYLGRGPEVARLLPRAWCLGHTKQGHPLHPLYVVDSAPLKPLRGTSSAHSERASHDGGPPPWPGRDAAIDEVIKFAATFNAYERWAAHPRQLEEMLQPLHVAWTRDRAIPSWAGIDAIRAYLFYRFRMDYFHGGTEEGATDMRAIVALARTRFGGVASTDVGA